MKLKLRALCLLLTLLAAPVALTGCEDSVVRRMIVTNVLSESADSIEKAEQPLTLKQNETAYVCASFIESPKSTKYTVRWSQSGSELKRETKEMLTDMRGTITWALENVQKGKLKVELMYGDRLIIDKEIEVTE